MEDVQIDANVVIEKLRVKLSEMQWQNVLLEAQLEQQLRTKVEPPAK